MEFSRQEYWSGLLCPPPGDLLDPGIRAVSLKPSALAGRFFTTSATWEVHQHVKWHFHSCHDNSEANLKGQRVGIGSTFGNPHLFPKVAAVLLLLLAYEITHHYKTDNSIPCGCPQLLRWPTLSCGTLFSLNKSTSHLSLCHSLNSFCEETSKTWNSRCVISIERPWFQ